MENLLIAKSSKKDLKLLMDIAKKLGIEVRLAPQNETKSERLSELKQAVQELTLIEKGRLKARPAKELLNEL